MPKERVGQFLLVLGSVFGVVALVAGPPWGWSALAALLIGGIAGYLLFYDIIQAYKAALRRDETFVDPRRVRRAARTLKLAFGAAAGAIAVIMLTPFLSALVGSDLQSYYPSVLIAAAGIFVVAICFAIPAGLVVAGDFLVFMRRQDSFRPPRK